MDSTLVSILVNAGIAGVFCVLFISGVIYPRSVVTDLKSEIKELKQAEQEQKDRADMATAALEATKDVIAAMHRGLSPDPDNSPGNERKPLNA